MENEQQNATALESANQEAIRLGREFLDGIEQNSKGVSTDEPEEPTITPELKSEKVEEVKPEEGPDLKVEESWEELDSQGLNKNALRQKVENKEPLNEEEQKAFWGSDYEEIKRLEQEHLDQERPWWHMRLDPRDERSVLSQASAAQFRDFATVPQEIKAAITGKDYTPRTLGELGFKDYSYQNTFVEGLAVDALDFLYDLIPALYIPGASKLLFGGGWKAAAFKTGVVGGIASTDIRTGGVFGTSKNLPKIKNQFLEWNAILKEGELTPFTNLPGLVELKEQVGEDHTSWDTNLYLNRFINISEFVAVEMTGEWALGGIMSKGWKLLKKVPLSELDKITGPAGVYIRNLRRNMDSFVSQKAALAKDQLNELGFGAHKNAGIKDTNQGVVMSSKKSFDIKNDLDALDGEIGAGSTKVPTNFTEQTIRNSAKKGNSSLLKTNLNDAAKELLGDSRYQQLLLKSKEAGKTFNEFFEPSFKRYQEMMGRNRGNLSTKAFWSSLKDGKTNTFGGLTQEDIVTTELVNNALLLQLRDIASATKTVINDSDIFVPDGPMRSIADRLVTGISMIKRSKLLQEGIENGISESAIAERITGMHDETVDGVKLMMRLMRNSDSKDLAHGVLEVFSSSNKIQNQLDFDKWMRQKISGGEFNGKVRTGVLVKELQQVMTNSMLLGPKTPQRAIWGTGFNTYLDQFNTVLGSAIRFGLGKTDDVTLQANTAALSGMIEVIPDALKVFRQRLDANFDKNLATVKSRFSHYSTKEHNWEMYRAWTEQQGTLGDQAAFFIADVGHKLNINRFLSGVPRVLRANDETFEWIATKGRTKELAMRQVLSEEPSSFPVINERTLSKVQDNLFNQYFDADGNLDISKDLFLKQRAAETTLQENMGNIGETLNRVFETLPQLKPFFFFMRTGVNSLKVNVRNQPLLAAMLKQQRQIAFGTAEDVKSGVLQKWGITTVEELENAKALLWGRQALGIGLVSIGVQKYLHNGLNGNGPQNRAMRKMWQDTGWERGRIDIAGKMVDLNLFEPWSIMFKAIADVGDNQGLMGDEWVEDRLSALAWIIAGNATSTTFLQGANQLIDIFSAQPGARTRTISNIFNNQVPGANLRNAIGKVLNPGLREFDNNIWDQIRSRNLTSELLTNKPLEFQYSMLDGEKLKDYHPLIRFLNAITIFNFTPKNDAGEQLLHDSNYDMRLSVTSTPSLGAQIPSISLIDNAELRSAFGRHVGETRINGLSLRDRLNLLAKDKKIIASLKAMREDQRKGNYGYDPMKTYYHNDKIAVLFDQYRSKGYATMIQQMRLGKYPELENLLNDNLELPRQMRSRRYETQQEPTPIPLHPAR